MNPAEKVAIGKTKLKVTRLGLGTGLLGAVHDDGPWSEIIKTAWDAGVRSFDTSPYYGFGTSEVRLGRALLKYDRRDYVVSTKVGRLLRPDAPEDPFAEAVYFPKGRPAGALRSVYDYSAAATRQSLVESRERLGLERIDIAHIHDIVELASGVDHFQGSDQGDLSGPCRAQGAGHNHRGRRRRPGQSGVDRSRRGLFLRLFPRRGPLHASRSVRDRRGPAALLAQEHLGHHWKSLQHGHPLRPETGLDLRLHAGPSRDDREGVEAESCLPEIQRSVAGCGDSIPLRVTPPSHRF